MTIIAPMHLTLIAALAENGGIGYEKNLPWPKKLAVDMTFFRFITSETGWNFDSVDDIVFTNNDTCMNSKNAVIMGRKTFESVSSLGIPPFKNRINIILSSSKLEYPDIHSFKDLDDALDFVTDSNHIKHCFVVGGGQIYNHTIIHPCCRYVIITQIFSHPNFPIDTWFPIDTLKSHFILKKNITLKVLEALSSWSGTGNLTRQVIMSNLKRYSNNSETTINDPYIIEHDLSFKFLLYERRDVK